ncbi:hypothetical protein TNCV_1238901 [Trichonephila clavipes]|nr:hypothetical protein TNCV_1238901 [Trichonephila clavipes]
MSCWIHGFMSLMPYSEPSVGFKQLESSLITPCYSIPVFSLQSLCSLAQGRRAARWLALSNGTLVDRRHPKPIW